MKLPPPLDEDAPFADLPIIDVPQLDCYLGRCLHASVLAGGLLLAAAVGWVVTSAIDRRTVKA